MLPSLIRTRALLSSQAPDPEDIFQSSLGSIFTDDLQTQHGDPGTIVVYRSGRFGDLEFRVADPQGEEERTKFAHYLWNAGVLMGELVAGRDTGQRDEDIERRRDSYDVEGDEEEWGVRKFAEGTKWWLTPEEEELWSVNGEKVLELGAGVGLAGIVSVLAGAEEVTITDYPSPTIIETIKANVSKNVPSKLRQRVGIAPHTWGVFSSTSHLTSCKGQYTVILAADTLWLSGQHTNLASSMQYFLSSSQDARVLVIAGFHTGRVKLAYFFEEVVPEEGLRIESIWEMDADGRRREWRVDREDEGVGIWKKWLVCATLKRRDGC